VMSVLSYLLPVWGSICAYKMEYFDAIMIRLVKRVLLPTWIIPTPKTLIDEFEKLNWLLAVERRDECMLRSFFKHFVMNNPLNYIMCELFEYRVTPGTDRSVRKERNLIIPQMKTSFSQNSFSYRVAMRWSDLPAHIQNQTTFPEFCDKLNIYIVTSRPDNYLLCYL